MRNVSLRKTARGFTLIELLVVIAIIGLLSSIVLASLSIARSRGRDGKRISDMRQISVALELYKDSNGGTVPPSDTNDQGCSTYCLTDLANELVPTYIPSIPLDPTWGNVANNGYRYCRLTPSTYTLLVVLHNGGGWCAVQHASTVTGTGCWFTNGVPDFGWCKDEF